MISYFKLNPKQKTTYTKDGYIIIENFLTATETELLSELAQNDTTMSENAIDLNDKSGKKTKLTSCYFPGNDAYGLLTRSKRMVESVDNLLEGDGEIYHFHSKLMQKEPQVGGAWEWHQDYGYWYKNEEFLFPNQMISVMVAITDADSENGCLQVIKGSHKMGRVDHGFVGEQVGASQHYVSLALKTMDLVYVELKAGDALFFHSNLLHRSDANLSKKSRWSLISCYNRSSNVPYHAPSNSSTTPLKIVPNDALLDWEKQSISDSASFVNKEHVPQKIPNFLI